MNCPHCDTHYRMVDLADKVLFREMMGKRVGMLKCIKCKKDVLVEMYTAVRPVVMARRKTDSTYGYNVTQKVS